MGKTAKPKKKVEAVERFKALGDKIVFHGVVCDLADPVHGSGGRVDPGVDNAAKRDVAGDDAGGFDGVFAGSRIDEGAGGVVFDVDGDADGATAKIWELPLA